MMNQEPSTRSTAVRRFRDPAYRPKAHSLAQLRQGIDDIDAQLVELLARRAALVKDATRFKRDAYQVSAPARQAEVFARVRALAAERAHGFDRLPDVAEATWRAMVAAFIECEQSLFAQTEPIDAAHPIGPNDPEDPEDPEDPNEPLEPHA